MAQKVQIPAMFVDSNSALATWQMSKLHESKSRAHLLLPCFLYTKSFSGAVAKGAWLTGLPWLVSLNLFSWPCTWIPFVRATHLAFVLCNLQQCCLGHVVSDGELETLNSRHGSFGLLVSSLPSPWCLRGQVESIKRWNEWFAQEMGLMLNYVMMKPLTIDSFFILIILLGTSADCVSEYFVSHLVSWQGLWRRSSLLHLLSGELTSFGIWMMNGKLDFMTPKYWDTPEVLGHLSVSLPFDSIDGRSARRNGLLSATAVSCSLLLVVRYSLLMPKVVIHYLQDHPSTRRWLQ